MRLPPHDFAACCRQYGDNRLAGEIRDAIDYSNFLCPIRRFPVGDDSGGSLRCHRIGGSGRTHRRRP